MEVNEKDIEKQVKESIKYRLEYLTELENKLKEEKENAYFKKIEKLKQIR